MINPKQQLILQRYSHQSNGEHVDLTITKIDLTMTKIDLTITVIDFGNNKNDLTTSKIDLTIAKIYFTMTKIKLMSMRKTRKWTKFDLKMTIDLTETKIESVTDHLAPNRALLSPIYHNRLFEFILCISVFHKTHMVLYPNCPVSL